MNYLSDEKNEKFSGDGSRNEDGQTLKEFLDEYDPYKYKNPSSTVDMAVFTFSKKKEGFKILLVKRKNHPSIGQWVIPGGFVEFDEDIDKTARRELKEETGVNGVIPVQVKSYGQPDRDPRTRIITTMFAALVPEDSISPEAGDDAADAALFDVSLTNMGEGNIHLELLCEERELKLSADLERLVIPGGIVPVVKHRMVKTEGVGLDHGVLIAEAYLFVMEHRRSTDSKICS